MFKKEKELNDRFERARKKSRCEYIDTENWNRFKKYKNGALYIRCQVGMRLKDGTLCQCKFRALNGKLTCKFHSSINNNSLKKRAKDEFRKITAGIYNIEEEKALQKELKEIENISEEEMTDIKHEIRLGVALLRKFLKENSDSKIMQAPGRLAFLLDRVVEFKKKYFEIKHSKETSYTKEQVEFILLKIRMAIIEVIKDQEMLKEIAEKIAKIGIELKEQSFKR